MTISEQWQVHSRALPISKSGLFNLTVGATSCGGKEYIVLLRVEEHRGKKSVFESDFLHRNPCATLPIGEHLQYYTVRGRKCSFRCVYSRSSAMPFCSGLNGPGELLDERAVCCCCCS